MPSLGFPKPWSDGMDIGLIYTQDMKSFHYCPLPITIIETLFKRPCGDTQLVRLCCGGPWVVGWIAWLHGPLDSWTIRSPIQFCMQHQSGMRENLLFIYSQVTLSNTQSGRRKKDMVGKVMFTTGGAWPFARDSESSNCYSSHLNFIPPCNCFTDQRFMGDDFDHFLRGIKV